MIFTTERPPTNPERCAIWRARSNQHKTERDAEIERLFRDLRKPIIYHVLTSITGFLAMAVFLASLFVLIVMASGAAS